MGTLPDSLAETALARLFAHERREGAATWFSLPGGSHLFTAGEPADHLYFLRAGRLGAFRRALGRLACGQNPRPGLSGAPLQQVVDGVAADHQLDHVERHDLRIVPRANDETCGGRPQP